MKVQITIEDNEESLREDVRELGALLRESAAHIFNLMYLTEGPRYINNHEYFKNAMTFWALLRDGMCSGHVRHHNKMIPCDGERHEDRQHCKKCLDKHLGKDNYE